jgi:hypothetical protein
MGVLVVGCQTWGHWTGQLQGWSLFAPAVPRQAVVPIVELRWDEEAHWPPAADVRHQVLRPQSEPDNPAWYFRPFAGSRLPCNYEATLTLVAWGWDEEAATRDPEKWHSELTASARRHKTETEAYLVWQLRRFRREHPNEPSPKQIILLARVYRIPPPGTQPWSLARPIELPVARWTVSSPPRPGFLPIDAYNPITHQFEPVPEEPAT